MRLPKTCVPLSSLGWLYLTFVLVSGCGSFAPQYRLSSPTVSSPRDSIIHTLFFVGGFGESDEVNGEQLLQTHLATAPEASTLLILGNFIDPKTNPFLKRPRQVELPQQLEHWVQLLQAFPGKTIFVPGYLEWREQGIAGLNQIQSYFSSFRDGQFQLLPQVGCFGPEEVELLPNVDLLILDSQWWLENWTGQSGLNEGCFIGNREVLNELLRERLRNKGNRTTLIAMHHSLFSEGRYAGIYSARDHIFPFLKSNPKLWVPLPILGSLPPFYRYTAGLRQDISHPKFRDFRRRVLTAARQSGNFIFLSAHEQVMHYLEREEQQFLIAGSGGQAQATRLGKGGEFAAGQVGFGKIQFHEDGAVWLEYWQSDQESELGKRLFRKMLRPKKEGMIIVDTLGLSRKESFVQVPFSKKNYQREGVGQKLWGAHYRKVYPLEVKLPLLWFEKFPGGLFLEKATSGQTTQNLEILTDDGQAFELRSLDKNAERSVPYPFNSSLFVKVIEDNFSAIHPLATLPLARLQEAAGIPHTKPTLWFLPQQQSLGRFNRSYGDAIYIMEENPAFDQGNFTQPYGASHFLTTSNMIRALLVHPDHFPDERALIRARLFDFLIGDWDRGFEQWQWGAFPDTNGVRYLPLGLGHEQAFSRYDGWIAWLSKLLYLETKPLRKYDSQITGSIRKETYNSRFLDRGLITRSGLTIWEEEAVHLQKALPDSLLLDAFLTAWPEKVFQLDGGPILASLKQRRDKLGELAVDFYELLARDVNVLGSVGRDWFVVERLPNKKVKITVYETGPDGTPTKLRYQRLFDRTNTRSVILYGLGGNDHFQLNGQNFNGPTVRLIGGPGVDEFQDSTSGFRLFPKTLLYDMKEEDRLVDKGPGFRRRFSRDSRVNSFNPVAVYQDYPVLQVLPKISINPDDALVLGIGAQFTTFGFKKRPFETRQRLVFQWGTATNGFALDYSGEVSRVLGPFSLYVEARYQTPLYTINFYGFGNETPNLEKVLGRNFNRVRQNLFRVAPGLRLRLKEGSYFTLSATYEQIKIEQVPGRILSEEFPTGVDSTVFSWQRFLGPKASFQFTNLNDPAFPSRGINVMAQARVAFRITERPQPVPDFRLAMSSYLGLTSREDLVLAGRVGFQHLFTDDYLFYRAATIGGSGENRTTRGFRRDRFTGRTALYSNGELRWRFLQSQNRSFPFSLGAYVGLDLGRVWFDGERSRVWHHGYGGGIFFSPMDLFTGVLDVFYGDRERLTVFADFKFYF